MGGESRGRSDGSGAAPNVGVPLNDHIPPDSPLAREAAVKEEAR